jgi:ribosomal protein L31E
MVENKDSIKKEAKKTKKLEELKETPENKAAVAESEGKKVEAKKEEKKSKSAVEKINDKRSDKKEKKVEVVEREYVVPLRRGFLNVPQYRRAKKAVRVLKEFMVRHMAVHDRDLRKVKVDIDLNNEIWFRGIKKPLHRVKVKAIKRDGIVHVSLADAPDVVGFRVARRLKRRAAQAAPEKVKKAVKEVKDDDKNKDGVKDDVAEKEDAKSEALRDEKVMKAAAKAEKHTVQGKHEKKVVPRKSNPKK